MTKFDLSLMSFYILLAIAVVTAVYVWRREKSRLAFYNLGFYVIVILFATGQDFVKYEWHLSGAALFVSNAINAIFWTAAAIGWISIMVKFLTRK